MDSGTAKLQTSIFDFRDVFDIATGEAVFVKETAQGKILVGRLGRGNDKSAKVAEIKE